MCVSQADTIHYSAGDGRQKSVFKYVKNTVMLGIRSLPVLLLEYSS